MRLPTSPHRRTAGLPRPAPLLAFLIGLSLVAASCGGAVQTAMDDAESPVVEEPSPTESMVVVPPDDGVPFVGEPPIWPLSYDETQALERVWAVGVSGDELEVGLPEGCFGIYAGESGSEATEDDLDRCMVATYAARGVGEAALDLYRERRWTVYDVQGSGPVWVASFAFWPFGGPSDMSNQGQRIFTPSGNYGTDVVADVIDDANESETLALIEEALNVRENDYGYWVTYLFPWRFSTPKSTGDGWEVARLFGVQSCNACQVEFALKVVYEFDSEGSFTGVRSLGFCWDERYWAEKWDETTPEIEELHATLPTCATEPAAELRVPPQP